MNSFGPLEQIGDETTTTVSLGWVGCCVGLAAHIWVAVLRHTACEELCMRSLVTWVSVGGAVVNLFVALMTGHEAQD